MSSNCSYTKVFWIVRGFDGLNTDQFFKLDHGGGYALRGHKQKLKVNRCRLQLRQCFFSQNQINSCFSVPPTTRTTTHYIVQLVRSLELATIGSPEEECFQAALYQLMEQATGFCHGHFIHQLIHETTWWLNHLHPLLLPVTCPQFSNFGIRIIICPIAIP